MKKRQMDKITEMIKTGEVRNDQYMLDSTLYCYKLIKKKQIILSSL